MRIPLELGRTYTPQECRGLAEQIRGDLSDAKIIRARTRSHLNNERRRLRSFQRQRLSSTHASLLQDPSTSSAAHFFLSDIYPQEPPAWRDSQTLNAIGSLARMLPSNALLALASACALEMMSEELDEQTLHAWMDMNPSMPDNLYPYAYASVSEKMRTEQVELTNLTGRALCVFARMPLIRHTLWAMRIPAKIAGLSEVHSFLERGFNVFSSLDNPNDFCNRLYQEELKAKEAFFEAALHQPPG